MDSLIVIVENVLSNPIEKKEKWFVKVGFYCFGRYFKQDLEFNSEKEAKEVKIGYKFNF